MVGGGALSVPLPVVTRGPFPVHSAGKGKTSGL